LNRSVTPPAMLGLAGVTAIDCSVAAVTVRVAFPEMLPEVAVMTDEPAARLVTRPPVVTVATEVVPEVQVAEAVMSLEEPSE